MKKLLIIFTLIGTGHLAYAQTEFKQPCLEVKKACKSATQAKLKNKEGRGQVKECMRKLANGESVDGVNVASEVVTACKEKREQHKSRREASANPSPKKTK